jgi:hypothetical protein
MDYRTDILVEAALDEAFANDSTTRTWCCDCGDAPVWQGSEGNETCQPCDLARRERREADYFDVDRYLPW